MKLNANPNQIKSKLSESGGLERAGGSTARFEGFVERWHTDRLRYLRKHFGLTGALCARLGTTWAFGAWALQRALFMVRDPFLERVGSYIRFLRA